MSSSKSVYRAYLLEVKPFIKINAFCKMLGINQSAVSMFIKDSAYDHMVTAEKLNDLCNLIQEFCSSSGNFA